MVRRKIDIGQSWNKSVNKIIFELEVLRVGY